MSYEVEPWEVCTRASCNRHQRCMYLNWPQCPDKKSPAGSHSPAGEYSLTPAENAGGQEADAGGELENEPTKEEFQALWPVEHVSKAVMSERYYGESLPESVSKALDGLAEHMMIGLDLAAHGSSTVFARIEPGKPVVIISEEEFYASQPPPMLLLEHPPCKPLSDGLTWEKLRKAVKALEDQPRREYLFLTPEEQFRPIPTKPDKAKLQRHHPVPKTPRRYRP